MDFLETGTIRNSVNFPTTILAPHQNPPALVSASSTRMNRAPVRSDVPGGRARLQHSSRNQHLPRQRRVYGDRFGKGPATRSRFKTRSPPRARPSSPTSMLPTEHQDPQLGQPAPSSGSATTSANSNSARFRCTSLISSSTHHTPPRVSPRPARATLDPILARRRYLKISAPSKGHLTVYPHTAHPMRPNLRHPSQRPHPSAPRAPPPPASRRPRARCEREATS